METNAKGRLAAMLAIASGGTGLKPITLTVERVKGIRHKRTFLKARV